MRRSFKDSQTIRYESCEKDIPYLETVMNVLGSNDFFTHARSGRIDMVKENLGHEKYETTEIYIGTLEQSRDKYRKCMNGHWKSFMPADVRT